MYAGHPATGHIVQHSLIHPVDAPVGAEPQAAIIIIQNLQDGVVDQPFLRSKIDQVFLGPPRQPPAIHSNPQSPL